MLKIGITGNIGTGKTEVCKILESLGAPIIYADEIAKILTSSDESIKQVIRKLFGDEVYNPNGTLNRKIISHLIFKDAKLKSKLEKIVHPKVINFIINKFNEFQLSKNYKIVFVEAALIYESNVDKILDYVIVISSSENDCITRVVKRDKVSKAEVLNRLKTQMCMKDKIKMADFIIHNNGTLIELKEKVYFLYNLLIQLDKPKV